MRLSVDQYRLQDSVYSVFFDRLRGLFAAMDRDYTRAAEHYRFQCTGCPNNCCQTHFYHYTYLEYLFLLEGFHKSAPARQRKVISRAKDVLHKVAQANEEGKPVWIMCPLNDDGWCTLYACRPMICRLHGIPHEFQKLGQKIINCPGCKTFDERCSNRHYYPFDRTPFYFEMAQLEKDFKQAAGITGKLKVTIAEMIFGAGRSASGKEQWRETD